jgi:hypothetical protein
VHRVRVTVPRPDTRSTTDERFDALERGQAQILAGQSRIFALLERGRVAHAGADVRLLIEIDKASPGLPFRAAHVMRRAEDVPELKEALAGAFVESAQELGKCFARLEGVTVDGGLRLERVRMMRGGWLWRIVRTDDQCAADA